MIRIDRFTNNPLIEPSLGSHWMSRNVFNCGVVRSEGLYKMLFRGSHTRDQSMSECGLALSEEGTEWYVLDRPVLECGSNPQCARGIEDPRIVQWTDGDYYVFATASSASGGRVGIWRTKNFFTFDWLGTPFNQEDKDACIFPEPINGQVFLLHRRAPHIWISSNESIESPWQGGTILTRSDEWYNHPTTDEPPTKIGIAGPPVKTAAGWLVITHVVHQPRGWDISRRYSLGFMVLDLEDPSKVRYIHPEPILSPEERYEINGTVPNVVFSCATVDTGGDAFYIYWGGADTVICGGRLMKRDLVVPVDGEDLVLFPDWQ